jgi:hypothetical protein
MLAEALWTALPWALAIGGTAAAAAALRSGNLSAVVGILFLLASLSRFGMPFAGSTIRIEQPAAIAVIALLLIRNPGSFGTLSRRATGALACGSLYLLAHVLASAVAAPDTLESLKIDVWLAISMAAGAAVAVLAMRADREFSIAPWIVGTALLHSLVALLAVASQVILKTDWGVQHTDVLIGKAYGLSHEANLFGILVALALPFVMTGRCWAGLSGSPPARVLTGLALAIGLGLSYSRGSLIAFGVAAGVLATAFLLPQSRVPRAAGRLVSASVLVLLVAAGTNQAQVLLAKAGARETANVIIVGVPAPSLPASATARPHPTASPDVALQSPEIVGTGDTLSVRMRSIRGGLEAFAAQPLLGHGTDSYGQRHREISCKCPAQISNLPIATLYEAGIPGAIGLGGLLVAVMFAVWRARAWAVGAALVAMLVGYLFTDALRFAASWILLGIPVGMAAAGWQRARTVDPECELSVINQ